MSLMKPLVFWTESRISAHESERSQSSEELVRLFQGLESSVTVFGGGVDEFDIDRFQVRSHGRSDDAGLQ